MKRIVLALSVIIVIGLIVLGVPYAIKSVRRAPMGRPEAPTASMSQREAAIEQVIVLLTENPVQGIPALKRWMDDMAIQKGQNHPTVKSSSIALRQSLSWTEGHEALVIAVAEQNGQPLLDLFSKTAEPHYASQATVGKTIQVVFQGIAWVPEVVQHGMPYKVAAGIIQPLETQDTHKKMAYPEVLSTLKEYMFRIDRAG